MSGNSIISRRFRLRRYFPAGEQLETRTLLATLVVNIEDPDCRPKGPVYCEIQQAVDAAVQNDTVEVAAGTYQPITVAVSGITITEATPESNPVIDAAPPPEDPSIETNGVVSRAYGATFQGLTVRNATFAGFILLRHDAEIANGANLNTLIGNSTMENRRGYYINGVGNTLSGNTSANDDFGFGIDASGENNLLVENTAEGDGAAGFFVGGRNNRLVGNVASGNDTGFFVSITLEECSEALPCIPNENVFENNIAIGNANNGFHIGQANLAVFQGNTAQSNGQFGFFVNGAQNFNNRFIANACRNNTGAPDAVGPDNHGGGLCVDLPEDLVLGDTNVDGIFESNDLILSLAAGKYESGRRANYLEGDWDGDNVFDSSDLIAALAAGHFVLNGRPA